MKHYVFGDYVLTGIENAFNKKTSFWMSKKNYTISVYCFSTYNNPMTSTEAEKELKRHLENIESYKNLFELQVNTFKK